jgi:hypothetical protein
MSKTISLFSAHVIGVITPFALQPGPASAVPVAGDLDGDLSGALDCAPLDPSIHPGAPDRPDLAFTDTNCDGIDGNKANAVFVSSTAPNDDGSGTMANPKKLITSAIALAAADGKDVYVTGGNFPGTLALADDVSVYGGYTPDFASRSAAEITNVNGVNGPAALAVGDTGVVLQLLSLHGARELSDGNSYGVRAVSDGVVASQVVLENVKVTADAAGAAINGSNGSSGFPGAGGAGSVGGQGSCVPGVPGPFGSLTGGAGSNGNTGANGTLGVPNGPTWSRLPAPGGTAGTSGAGGRGGQGGTAMSAIFGITACGGQGGTGGSGGGGGFGGFGGQGGAGSFGVYSYNSSIVAVGSTLTAGNGGAGGNGGIGGTGGAGTGGAFGVPGDCVLGTCGLSGSQGQPGFSGGNGGHGGGGVGGPSAGAYQGGPTSGYTSVTTSATPGTAGLGGFPGLGAGGVRAPSGASVPVLRTAAAPEASTYDFDSDGVADPADACPADAGGTNGCPGPETTIVSGPADGSYLLSQATSLGLSSTAAGSTFACSLDGGDADTCTSPQALSGLAARTHVFKAWATDGFGSADPSAASRTFTVPVNNTALTHSTGWTKKTGTGYFRNTYSTSSKQGAALSLPVTGARRVALVATKAPGQGKVNIMLGQTLLKQVNLSSATTQKKQVFESVLPAARSGTIKLVVATSGKPVRIEGLGVVTQ